MWVLLATRYQSLNLTVTVRWPRSLGNSTNLLTNLFFFVKSAFLCNGGMVVWKTVCGQYCIERSSGYEKECFLYMVIRLFLWWCFLGGVLVDKKYVWCEIQISYHCGILMDNNGDLISIVFKLKFSRMINFSVNGSNVLFSYLFN